MDIKTLNLAPAVFERPYNEALIHQVVTARLSNRRAGTHQQKTRAEVSFSGAKPWNQKGSGRARAGTKGSPIWRSGGVTFAARPTDYSQKINKKMYHGALCSILSQLIRDNRLIIVDNIKLGAGKTKELLSYLSNLNLERNMTIRYPLLILNDAEIDAPLVFASRNLKGTEVVSVDEIDPVELLRHEHTVITKEALVKLNEVLQHG